jgi:hypothetical protein
MPYLTATGQRSQARDETNHGPPFRARGLRVLERASRACDRGQCDERPAEQQRSLWARDAPVYGDQQQRQRRDCGPHQHRAREAGVDRGDQRPAAGDGKRQERRASEKRAGGGGRQALRVGGDPGREVFKLKAREHDGENERRHFEPRGDAEQAVEEQFGAGDYQHDPGDQQRERRHRSRT